MASIERWIGQSRMSDPTEHAASVAALPPNIADLNNIVQGVLIHADWLSAYGVDETRLDAVSRTTLPVGERLE